MIPRSAIILERKVILATPANTCHINNDRDSIFCGTLLIISIDIIQIPKPQSRESTETKVNTLKETPAFKIGEDSTEYNLRVRQESIPCLTELSE
jgi:hypothetical protein